MGINLLDQDLSPSLCYSQFELIQAGRRVRARPNLVLLGPSTHQENATLVFRSCSVCSSCVVLVVAVVVQVP